MKIEWLVTDVTTVGSPDIAERAILGVLLAGFFLVNFCDRAATCWLGVLLANSGRICGRGATL